MLKAITVSFLTVVLTSGCLKQVSQPASDTLPDSVRTIAMLPVTAAAKSDDGAPPSAKSSQELQAGIDELNQILSDYFESNPKVQQVSAEEVDSLTTSYNANRLNQSQAIGKTLKAEAVMLWSLTRYHERSGRDYAVHSPASVAFDYRLIHTESGQTLCAGTFDETQQSLSENLLSLRALANRGLRWITAADLAREGVHKKMPDCKYLQ